MHFNFTKFLSALRSDLQPVAIAVASVEGLKSSAPGEDKQQDALNLLGAGLAITSSINQGAATKAASVASAVIPLIEEMVALFNGLGLFKHKATAVPAKTPPSAVTGVGGVG